MPFISFLGLIHILHLDLLSAHDGAKGLAKANKLNSYCPSSEERQEGGGSIVTAPVVEKTISSTVAESIQVCHSSLSLCW